MHPKENATALDTKILNSLSGAGCALEVSGVQSKSTSSILVVKEIDGWLAGEPDASIAGGLGDRLVQQAALKGDRCLEMQKDLILRLVV